MKLLRFGPPGQERPGVLVRDGEAVDVSAHVDDYDRSFFANGGLDRLQSVVDGSTDLPTVALDEVRLAAPIARPGEVLCIGLNYADHAEEAGMAIPEQPVLFNKLSNTVVGPNDDVERPRASTKLDWEVELAVVIGRTCRYLDDLDDARDAIAGYAVANDVSERTFQLERGGQWSKGKSAATFNPLGPWLVTPDEVEDAQGLRIGLDLNGEPVQDGSTETMIFDVPTIIHYLSQFMVLEPGDLINTGTPPGVGMGMRPPRYLEPGDVVEPWIEGLGRQRSRIVEAR